MFDWLMFVGALVFLIAVVVILTIVAYKLTDGSCKHAYERIDDYNDKKMILVCRKCGKIKKLRK